MVFLKLRSRPWDHGEYVLASMAQLGGGSCSLYVAWLNAPRTDKLLRVPVLVRYNVTGEAVLRLDAQPYISLKTRVTVRSAGELLVGVGCHVDDIPELCAWLSVETTRGWRLSKLIVLSTLHLGPLNVEAQLPELPEVEAYPWLTSGLIPPYLALWEARRAYTTCLAYQAYGSATATVSGEPTTMHYVVLRREVLRTAAGGMVTLQAVRVGRLGGSQPVDVIALKLTLRGPEGGVEEATIVVEVRAPFKPEVSGGGMLI